MKKITIVVIVLWSQTLVWGCGLDGSSCVTSSGAGGTCCGGTCQIPPPPPESCPRGQTTFSACLGFCGGAGMTACGCVQGSMRCVAGSFVPSAVQCCSSGSCCVPNCSCASTTPIGQTCSDGCGGKCAGTLNLNACIPPKFKQCGSACCNVSAGETCAIASGGSHCCPSGMFDCNGACCNSFTQQCIPIIGIQTCVNKCTPNCACAATTNVGQSCSDGCGGFCLGTKPVGCTPNCSCASTTLVGSTCSDGCGGTCAGTKPACTPNCATAATLCNTQTISDGCGGTCTGLLSCCAAGKICGKVTAAEVSTLALPNIVMTLHDSKGTIIQSATTDANGHYTFSPTAGTNFFVRAEPDRTWNPSPGQIPVAPGNVPGNFQIRFVQADVTITAPPATFVLITANQWNQPRPPPQGTGQTIVSFTGVADLNGEAKLKVSYGTYYVTCWKLNSQLHYQRGASVPLNGGAILNPLDKVTMPCP